MQTKSEDINFSIREAAAKGNLSFLKEIFSRKNQTGINVNAAGPTTGKTALHQAVINNQEEVVEYLLTLPNIEHKKDKTNKFPADYSLNKYLNITRLLLRKFTYFIPAPSTDLAHKIGPNLYYNIRNNCKNMSTAEIMKISQTVFRPGSVYMGCSFLFHVSLFSNNWDAIAKLIEAGEDPNKQACDYQPLFYRNTPLHAYLANEDNGAITFIETVHKAGKQIDFTIQDDQGKTTLLLATKIRRSDLVQKLLDFGAHVALSIPDNNGLNILHITCALGDLKNFELLKGYEEFKNLCEQKDNKGRLPFELLELNKEETSNLLKSIYIKPERDFNAPRNDAEINSFKPAGFTFLEQCFRERENIKEQIALTRNTSPTL